MEPSVTSFYQIILNSALQERKLKFPNKFVHERGNELYDTVRLSVPTGCCWDVKVKREDDGTIWLHDGLHKFMEENSIGFGYFLYFKYEGNSKFIIHIYGLTATEILYSRRSDTKRCDVNELQLVDGTDDSSRRESGDEDADDDSGKASDDCADDSLNNESVDKDSDDDIDDSFMSESSDEDADENDDSLDDSLKNATENKSSPNFFKVTLTHYHVTTHLLRVPAAFARLHMPQSKTLIKLVDGENREWAVRYIHQGGNRALSAGWKSFLQDKKLHVGDVCMFERVLCYEEVKLRVTVSRSDLKKSTMNRRTTRNGGTNASPSGLAKERITCPENKSSPNFFEVTMTPSYIKRNQLTVRSGFARLHIQHSTRLIKLVDAENNEWVVHYFNQGRQKMLGSGWGNFVQDKELMVGDVCRFERVPCDNEVKLRVTISRPDGKKSTMHKDPKRNDGVDASPGDLGKERIIEPSNSSLPNFCKVTLTPTYIERRHLRLPAAFARLHMHHSTRLVKLVDAENNEWAVRYIGNNVLTTGWIEFVQDKKLMVGDVCMFEHVSGGNEVKLRVTISR